MEDDQVQKTHLEESNGDEPKIDPEPRHQIPRPYRTPTSRHPSVGDRSEHEPDPDIRVDNLCLPVLDTLKDLRVGGEMRAPPFRRLGSYVQQQVTGPAARPHYQDLGQVDDGDGFEFFGRVVVGEEGGGHRLSF
jgi:hypothetical protein